MSGLTRAGRLAAALVLAALAGAAQADTSDLVSDTALRVCADPSNMPFSNERGEGFENAIAEMLGEKMGKPVTYAWFPQALGFVRKTLSEHKCDVIIGYAQGDELVLNTNHYYVSAYAFVTRADGDLADVDHIGDPRLKGRKLGVIAGSPPADHLARAGLIGSVKGYRLMVDTRVDNVSDLVVADLASGAVDGAFLWGPIAGWKALSAPVPLKVTPLLKEQGSPRMFFRVTMGVRQGEDTWKRELNSLIRRHQGEINAILARFGVPLVDEFGRPAPAAGQ